MLGFYAATGFDQFENDGPYPGDVDVTPRPPIQYGLDDSRWALWRENSRSQNVVSELLKNLRENSTGFRFTFKGAKGEDVVLRDEQILDITVTGKEGELGFPFEITLPLAATVSEAAE